MIEFTQTETARLAYEIFGEGRISIVVELALGSTMGEWRHLAEKMAQNGTVLLYERAGIASSGESTLPRTPKNIALELRALLDTLPHEDKITIVAHSQGGLYAQKFARSYPDMVRALVLLDPLSANDNKFKELLTPEEYKKGGIDKFSNLGILETLSKLHLGFLIKAVMRSAPPFYYYIDFPADTADYILNAQTKPSIYRATSAEYRLSHDENEIAGLKARDGFPDIPLMLITHSSAQMEQEIRKFGRATSEQAQKVERVWQELMCEYLDFTPRSEYVQAKHSSHYIHLTEPELIFDALQKCGAAR